MRLSFRETPRDLYVVGAVAGLTALLALVGPSPIRVLLAIPAIFFAPGYMIAAALFPRHREVDWLERIGISVGLSIASVALLGLLLAAGPWGFRTESVVAGLLGFTLAAGAVAQRRRMLLAPAERLGLAVDLERPRWTDLSKFDRALAIGLAIALASSAFALGILAVGPHNRVPFTEFYVLDRDGGVSAYPSVLSPGESATVVIGVANYESRAVNYTVDVRLVAVQVVFNQTTGRNETVELWNTSMNSWAFDLAVAERREAPYSFQIANMGLYQVRFLLFLTPVGSMPYRQVQLPVEVR